MVLHVSKAKWQVWQVSVLLWCCCGTHCCRYLLHAGCCLF